jgi:D-alanyl-D-alanine carboxypeptidase
MKKKAIIILTVLIFILTNTTALYADNDTTATNTQSIPQVQPPSLPQGSYILIDAATGDVLAEQNSDSKKYPASTTKIITAILALEMGDLNQVMTASLAAINDIGKDGSNIGIMAGEQMKMGDLLKALMISSANETANIIAENLCPTRDEFVDLMNKKAVELGAVNTHFENPCGAHEDNHYTTPADLAKIARYAMTIPEFRDIVKMTYYSLPSTNKHRSPNPDSSSTTEPAAEGDASGEEANNGDLSGGTGTANNTAGGTGANGNAAPGSGSSSADTQGGSGQDNRQLWPARMVTTNKLLQYYNDSPNYVIDGVKTGYTGPAGYCLVSSATANDSGLELIAVVMGLTGSEWQKGIRTFSKSLLEYGFNNFKTVTLIDKDTTYRSVAVEDAKDETPLHLVTDNKITCLLPAGYDTSKIEEKAEILDVISAPVNKGDIIGSVEFTKDGKSLGKINLLASRSVEMKTNAVIKSKFLEFFKNPAATAVCIIIPAFIILRIVLRTISRRRKSRRY